MAGYTVVVTIGRNVGSTPLGLFKWINFQRDINVVMQAYGGMMVQAPDLVGGSSQRGIWGRVTEEASAFVALFDAAPHWEKLVDDLRNTGTAYGQEAIGYIVAEGTQNLIYCQPGVADE